MHTSEPEDAVPAEYQARPADPRAEQRAAMLARAERRAWDRFRTSARIVGVHISDDGTELWSHGIGKPHYPMAGARAHVEEHGKFIVFTASSYELVVTVPSSARRFARGFCGEFNTHQARQ